MPRQRPVAPTFGARDFGWNSPDEPVKWWPLVATIAAGYLAYRYRSSASQLLDVTGVSWLYGLLWGNRLWFGARVSVAMLIIGIARSYPYQVELAVELWGSWITTGTFSKRRPPTLYARISSDRGPYAPALATVAILFALIEVARRASAFKYAVQVLWSDRSWLGFFFIAGAFLTTVAIYGERINQELVNFDLWLHTGAAMFGRPAPANGAG